MIMLCDIILIYLICSEYSITVLTNYKYSRIICLHPEGGLNINYSYCSYHMKGLGLAYLKFHVCSGLGACMLGPCMLGPCMLGPCMLGPCRSDSNLI